MNQTDIETVESAIRRCVAEFYRAGRADPLLGPIFEAHIAEWGDHLRLVENFWSKTLLGTDRYSGFPYPVHVPMPLTPAHIKRWVELFTAAARATLPPAYAEQACAKARHMVRALPPASSPSATGTASPAATRRERREDLLRVKARRAKDLSRLGADPPGPVAS